MARASIQGIAKRIGLTRSHPQLYICCHHKVGTVLLHRVFETICMKLGWSFQGIYGLCVRPPEAQVVLLAHSLLGFDLKQARPYRGIHVVRDPRDVIVSGYLYHKRCTEAWCINENFDLTPPILFPRVPLSQQHRPEEWKRQYLLRLANKSYQRNLLDRGEADGLLFEMQHYGAWTIESMLGWNYADPQLLELQFEALIGNFDETFRRIFAHCEFSKRQTEMALEIAQMQDLNRMSAQQLAERKHITTRQTSKWRPYFEDAQRKAFTEQFGDAAVRLGYENFE